MNKRLLMLLVIVFTCSTMIACTGFKTAATTKQPTSITIIEEPIDPPAAKITSVVNEEPKDKTAELKTQSYEALRGYTEVDFYDGEYFDVAAFARQAGCTCVLSSNLDEIIIRPIGYNDEETFEVIVKVSPTTQMVNGDTIHLGKIDGGWRETENHYSATDFTTGIMVDSYGMQIGFDELDYLWREIRLLTAPDDKFDEINAEIDAEIQSYYDLDIEAVAQG